MHIGHAKSICLNFGLAEKYNGKCNLRFDDTNPTKENLEYINSIIEDVKWLGFNYGNNPLYASDYFSSMYRYAIQLINNGFAYVDDQTSDEIRKMRGTLQKPGTPSPFRERTIKENLNLFEKMKEGQFKNGEKVLRAKIDMNSPNLNLRDPILYRILHETHHRTNNQWCIYPMYDWAHGIEDSIEKITHSICTLEFEDHRPLYDWLLNKLNIYHPKQIEFARLNLNYTIMSKRKLKILVDKNIVLGWDDPRMPTLSGLRRRGYTPKAIKKFVSSSGIVKRDTTSDIALLEYELRQDLNLIANRAMAVLDPIKVMITNYPDNKTEYLNSINNPEDSNSASRKIPFSKEIYIEKSDFMENPTKKYFRLSPGKEVRLKDAFYITCNEVIKNNNNSIKEIHCTYDPNTKGGWSQDGRKVKGTIHWVSIKHAINATINIYNRLFQDEHPDTNNNFLDSINPESLQILKNCKLEPGLANATLKDKFQFIRHGYFVLDIKSKKTNLIFNQSVGLRDNWAKKK
ncbi:MAG: glutamine--tRNA ligase [Candidatus Marinimicrobia bacterium]|nr:glutamine--tRNA ligase [Candidatus Neomarinimicrobiota bacterium]